MVQASRRTGSPDSALVRLLARLAELDVRESPQGFADRLGLWLRWTDATPLFTALKPPSEPRAPGDPAKAAAALQTAAGAGARLRTALARAIAEETAAATVEFRAPPVPLPGEKEATPGFAPYRRCVLARQSAMATGIAPLRGRLRMALSARSPALARLAAVDTVMEQVLGEQEHRLLAGIPKLLEKRFRQLRDAHAADGADAVDDWPALFQQELQSVLLAELDLRWQPIEGLIKTLRVNI